MSATELRKFITNYKVEDVEKLTVRLRNGLGSSKYKPAEYKRLQAIVDAKRLESDLIGQRVQKTCRGAKATKESSILRQHRQVWSREYPKLQKAGENAENDIHDFLEQIRPNGITDTAIFSLQDYELFLEREREAFRMTTVQPVHQLREDLCFRLGKVQHQQFIDHPSNWELVKQQINFVKDQQGDIIAKLQAEYLTLEEEIMALGLEKYLTPSDNPVNIEIVPEEVLHSDCSYPELKDSLIQAFHSLSEMYQNRLQSLQEQLQRTDKFCGWCADDHLHFQFTLSQYTHDVPNHRALCMDMLQRLFPEKTTHEVMEHERVCDWKRFTQAQLRVVTQQWQRNHEELLAKALVTLQEARHAHQEELELHRDRQHQQDICSHLRDKHSDTVARQDGEGFSSRICFLNALLSAAAPSDPRNSPDSALQQWRAQQEEVAKLEAAIAARLQEEEEAKLKRKQENEAAVRSHQKEKVQQFYLKQQRRREVLEQRDQERLANLRRDMEEQARRDKERVRFRADMLQRRMEEREAKAAEQLREEEERENRLDALRNQVRVVAAVDAERMMADTEAWRSRHMNGKEFELQKPLYSINTYTDTQIVSDPRLRVEQALRKAGLNHSQYAKDVLSVIKPPKPPRRDTKSMLEF